MKKLLIVLSILITSMNVIGNSNHTTANEIKNTSSINNNNKLVSDIYSGFSDGWYNADVEVGYQKYPIKVYVENNSVREIDFGNEMSVHSGYNNSGYTYSGGYLNFSSNYDGKITKKITTVTVTENHNAKCYKISIQ